MIVVMDGMGETWRTMRKAIRDGDATYVSDLTPMMTSSSSDGEGDAIQFVPSDVEERAMYGINDWREAESVYTFVRDRDANRLSVKVSDCLYYSYSRFVIMIVPPNGGGRDAPLVRPI